MGMPNVTMSASLMCSFGVAPATLVVAPTHRVVVEGKPAATVQDMLPANIPTFGMCSSLANPTVASATAAALGVLTPMPCVPLVAGPWQPGAARTTVGGMPALTAGSTCTCAYGGVVMISFPGSLRTQSG